MPPAEMNLYSGIYNIGLRIALISLSRLRAGGQGPILMLFSYPTFDEKVKN